MTPQPVTESGRLRPLRIAVVAACPFPLARGTPIRILRLAEALAGRGHEVHVATYHLGSGPVAPGVQLHRIREIRSYQKVTPGPTYRKLLRVDPVLGRLVRQLLRDRPFDVIHAHHYEGLLVGAAARAGTRVPLVYDAHTLLMSELPYFPMGLPASAKSLLGRWMDRHLPRLAEHTVCVTDRIRDKLVDDAGMDPARLSVVTNGIEVDHFDPAKMKAAATRNGKTLIFTGNLAEYQGIDLMLKAFQHVVARNADARLLIATDSSFAPYESLARELGVRERLDLVASPAFEELPRLLASADVAINPRTNCDGVPVKLLNYMAAARPVVSFASSAPGVTHGRNGWLAESGNVEALGEGIITLLAESDRARALGRAAREYVVEHCSWPMAAERCEVLYRELMRRTS